MKSQAAETLRAKILVDNLIEEAGNNQRYAAYAEEWEQLGEVDTARAWAKRVGEAHDLSTLWHSRLEVKVSKNPSLRKALREHIRERGLQIPPEAREILSGILTPKDPEWWLTG